MSPTPPSTTSSSVGAHSPEGQFRVIRKRNRVPLSCAPCRHRKLKCNRSHPCENCVKRGDSASCTYAQPGVRKKTTLNQNAVATPDDMQNRIDRLEGLVLSLMTNGSQSAGPTAAAAAISGHSSIDSGRTSNETNGPGDELEMDGQEESDTEQVTKSFGIMKVDNNKSYYISDAHWASVLNDIAEVRNYFTVHKKQYEEQAEKVKALRKDTDFSGSALLFGTVKPLSQAEIMSSFPSRYTTDILIARYFNSYDPSTHILHGPTFQKEYNRHWEDPSQTCIVWVGMLFVMMRLAMLSYHRDGDEPPEFRGKSLDMAGTYRNMMAQCLTLADYTKPHPHLIETLILHLHADYSQTRETETSVWILVGMIARLAMRMGYHRDSKSFPNITPFQGEMRRRVWTFVKQADLLFSFQAGLPSMIRSGDSDTELPRNLYDEDFDESCKELPPPRPSSEPTPISYLIAKARIAFTFGRVIEHTSSMKSGPYETVMEIDSELRRARDMIPEHLQVRPMEECQLDPASLIVSRFNIMSTYHKAQVVLHRRYLGRARENPRFTHSRRTCIDSSLELLSYQSILHGETRPNGRLRALTHQVMSLSSNDFLLAATVVCLDLYHGLQLQAAGRPSGDTYAWGVERRDEMLATIRRSKEIWDDLRDQSIEAWKASSILGVMLTKLHLAPQGTETSTASAPAFESQDEKENAAMTLGLLSSGMSPLNSGTAGFSDPTFRMAETLSPPGGGLGVPGIPQGATSPFSMLGVMPDMQPVNLDWEAWDSYIQSSNFDPSNQLWPMLDMQQQPSLSPISPSTVPTARNGVPEVSRNPYRPLPGLFPSQSNYDNGPSPENGVFMNLSNDNNSPSQPPGGLGRSQGAM
ncbi:transcriptional regulator family: Fungal Specific TF [Paecilomyces variotii]|nr:transcriptional regulator family: Fungal Specific TF [Paecilomyces variotii]